MLHFTTILIRISEDLIKTQIGIWAHPEMFFTGHLLNHVIISNGNVGTPKHFQLGDLINAKML